MSLARAYARTMWTTLSALTTWQPDVPLGVGDVVLAGPGGVVTRETTLAKLGVPTERLTYSRHPAAPVREHRGVTLAASGSAVVATPGKARLSFARQWSFLVVTDPGWQDLTDDMADARAVVEDLATRKVWRPGWHLVTSVRRYPACTIVIAKTAGAEAEVSLDVSAAGVVVEGIRAGVSVRVDSAQASHWVMNAESTPLYGAITAKRRGLRRWVSAGPQTVYGADEAPADADERPSGDEDTWTVQRSSPDDLGLL